MILGRILIIFTLFLYAQCIKEGWRNSFGKHQPYAVSIQYSTDEKEFQHLCTGSLLTAKWILTAASCFDNITEGDQIAANIGVETNKRSDRSQFLIISKRILHPDYNPDDPTNEADIALLRPEKPITFSRDAQPIRIPIEENRGSGNGTVYGWGGLLRKTQKKKPERAYFANVAALSKDECINFYDFLKEDIQFCVGGIHTTDAPCKGTPGIPFVQYDENRGIQYVGGIASIWPDTCEGPALFTSVHKYREFIEQYLNDPILSG